MARLTIVVGVILIALGVAVFIATGKHAPTALIPAFFGIVLGILGEIATTDNARRRMLFMHIAVTVGVVGVIFPGWRGVGDLITQMRGQVVLRPVAMKEELAMAAICLVYVILCVRSFISARKNRTTSA